MCVAIGQTGFLDYNYYFLTTWLQNNFDNFILIAEFSIVHDSRNFTSNLHQESVYQSILIDWLICIQTKWKQKPE